VQIILISLLTFAGSFFGTISGFGLSTILLPLIIILVSYPIALLFVGIIHFFENLWKIILFIKGADMKILVYFGISGVVFSIIGAHFVLNYPAERLTRILGLLLVSYVFLITFEPKLKMPNSKKSSFVGGALSGIMSGIFGTGGAIRSAFLSTYGLKKETYLFSSGAIAILIDAARILTYVSGGVRLTPAWTAGLLIFVPVSFLGAAVAQKTIKNVSQKIFRDLIALFIFLMGIKLIISP